MRSERWKTASLAAALFFLNLLLTARLLRIEYTREMGSIEAAFIGLARYIHAHFPDLNWFPLWYGGIPYPDSYPPLLHAVVAAVAAMGHISAGLSYHVVTAIVYALGPVTLFWAAWRLGAGRTAAFTAALLYSLLSPSCWLVREVRADTGGWFGPRRLVALVRYGEGPHLTSLLFVPLAIALLHVALEKRRPLYYVLAGISLAAAVLSNWIGAFALALGVSAYLLAGHRRAWLPAIAIGCYAYALAMPWATPSTIATIRANAPLVGGRFESGPKQLLAATAFAGGMLLLAWGMKRAKWPSGVRFGALFLYGTAVITLAAYWFHFSLLPQPQRYHLEMDMAFWLAVALAGQAIRLPARMTRQILFPAVVLAAVPLLVHQRSMARQMEQPIDIKSTVEYRVSRWLGEQAPARRVFAPGTIGFWMNAFSDTPLLTGGFDNGMRNTLLQDVIFQVYAGDKREVALDWLKAFGCDAVVGSGPASREIYHPYAHPAKFDGLNELWREGDDVIYEVPRRNRSLAHAVFASSLPVTAPPAYDTHPLAPYLAALDDPALPEADFRWLGASRAVITGDFRPEHLLSVQVTWDEGWHARVNGEPRRAWGDKLGQMAVEPRCSGPCTVELSWDGGFEMRLARILSGAALGGGLLWILAWRRKFSDSIRTS